ncbi:MAG: Flp family type IVb pilin [Eubacterium sp.]|nr:Flp family type IVb pilin [Eubacterium sp.]
MMFLKDENGQSMVEYALIVGTIAIAAVIVLVAFGPKIQAMFSKANNAAGDADGRTN